jgi:hypothetical protein
MLIPALQWGFFISCKSKQQKMAYMMETKNLHDEKNPHIAVGCCNTGTG